MTDHFPSSPTPLEKTLKLNVMYAVILSFYDNSETQEFKFPRLFNLDMTSNSWMVFLIKFPKASKSIKHVRPDMWPAYLKVINQKIPHANHVLDPFHVLYKT